VKPGIGLDRKVLALDQRQLHVLGGQQLAGALHDGLEQVGLAGLFQQGKRGFAQGGLELRLHPELFLGLLERGDVGGDAIPDLGAVGQSLGQAGAELVPADAPGGVADPRDVFHLRAELVDLADALQPGGPVLRHDPLVDQGGIVLDLPGGDAEQPLHIGADIVAGEAAVR
jgi:hypothetical protein